MESRDPAFAYLEDLYRIAPSYSDKVAGIIPQVKEVVEVESNRMLLGENLIVGGSPAPSPENLEIVLNTKSRRTDILSWNFRLRDGLIISARLKTFLEQFELGQSSFHELAVRGMPERSYYWLSIKSDGLQCLDYERSVFRERLNSRVVEGSRVVLNGAEDIDRWLREANVNASVSPDRRGIVGHVLRMADDCPSAGVASILWTLHG